MIKFVIVIFAILSGYWEHYSSRVNYETFLINSVSLEISSTTTLKPSCIWVKSFDALTLPLKILKSWHKLKVLSSFDSRISFGDINLCKFEVHSTFAVLVRGVFRTQSKIYDGVFCKNS